MDPDVMAMLQKSISAKLCPTVLGQVPTILHVPPPAPQSCMDIVADPPRPGEPSYESWLAEKEVSVRISATLPP
jgi:alanine transaminase